jgi:hypothetical protein
LQRPETSRKGLWQDSAHPNRQTGQTAENKEKGPLKTALFLRDFSLVQLA